MATSFLRGCALLAALLFVGRWRYGVTCDISFTVRITVVNNKRRNALIDLDDQPLPRVVDGILYSLYNGKVFSIDLHSALNRS